jgi:hypothetical protein
MGNYQVSTEYIVVYSSNFIHICEAYLYYLLIITTGKWVVSRWFEKTTQMITTMVS